MNISVRGTLKNLEKNLCQCDFYHCQLQIEWPGRVPRLPKLVDIELVGQTIFHSNSISILTSVSDLLLER